LLPRLLDYEVALIDKAKDINILLQNEYIVGLVGMGGIGKTTLSKKFYHLFHNQYDKSSFLEDVKSKDNINDVIKQLLHDLCGKRLSKDENVNQDDLEQIRQCMISKKMLVVVDDVGKAENLTSLQLLIDTKNETSKSKILVNCRNWQILKSHVSENGKVVMKYLEEEQARKLFMFHAFGNANHVPTKDFKDICTKIIKACGGLPLSLKILGSFLCNTKELETWEGALRKLKSGQNLTGGNENEEFWNVLKISYDHLDKQHQNMFLDIACFLGGLKISTICRMWNGDYLNRKFELQNLQHRSLIESTKDGILYMHEQLQDMGRNIAMELPIMNRFIWKSNESNFPLHKDEVVEHLEGISLKKCVNFPTLSQIGSKGFHNLRLVDLTEASPTIVQNFLQGRNLDNVKWLCLKKCMIRKLPNNLFYCLQLQVLDLAQCQSLEKIPSSLGRLKTLKEFDLARCENLKKLPSSIGQLNALQELDLSGCSNLKKLPSSIGQLNALQKLDLSRCCKLKELPSFIVQLNGLQKRYLSKCYNLKKLPSSIAQLNALQKLHLSHCSNLKKLPSSIGQLNALQKLDLNGCYNFKNQLSYETASSIANEKHINKFNFALIMTGYDMEKPFFLHCNKAI
jgi:energy-coupling factor transporter ATP-binding protein EcfA2